MKIRQDRIDDLINNSERIKDYLDVVMKEYRPYDPGSYLYKILLSKNSEIFKKENVELIYVTLSAWNMNQRGAKLSEFTRFYDSIIENKKSLLELQKDRIEKVNDSNFESLIDICKRLFENLELTQKKVNPPKLVTYSKTLHFIAPNLIVPIDRKYTLRFFRDNIMYDNSKSFEHFYEFHKSFRKISQSLNLEEYKDNVWNLNIPKIIDNLIIAYVKKKGLIK